MDEIIVCNVVAVHAVKGPGRRTFWRAGESSVAVKNVWVMFVFQ